VSKQEIRKKYLSLRDSLSSKEVQELSQQLCSLFFSSVDLSAINVMHTFLPIESKKEVNTWLIIDELKKKHPQIKISIPRVENDVLTNFYFEEKSQLKKNRWGIDEPRSGKTTATEEIDLVIVPLLAFDEKGHRIGYGRGYYDRFLKDCRINCKKTGLSFFEPLSSPILSDEHDVRLNSAITPSRVITFNP
jgi:5-formyltetrahydrofolate cyclo-ligase